MGSGAEQELLHVPVKKVFRLLVPQIESVVVDELLLELEPFAPADPADLFERAAAYVVLERLEGHSIPGLSAARAGDGCHGGKIVAGM